MTPRDPYDHLRELDPLSADELARAAASAPEPDEILARAKRRERLKPLYRRPRFALGGVAALAAAFAIGIVVWSTRPAAPVTVRCYSGATLRTHAVTLRGRPSMAARLCNDAWAKVDRPRAPREKPVVCRTGVALDVFLSADPKICHELGLKPR
jgi:hypothetical protein